MNEGNRDYVGEASSRVRRSSTAKERSMAATNTSSTNGYQFNAVSEVSMAKTKRTQRLKRPRGSLLRAIMAGNISARDAHKRGYMSKAQIIRSTKAWQV